MYEPIVWRLSQLLYFQLSNHFFRKQSEQAIILEIISGGRAFAPKASFVEPLIIGINWGKFHN